MTPTTVIMANRPLALRRVSVLALLALLVALVPQPAFAADIRGGESTVVEAGTTIDDDLYAFGNAVDVRGTVNGDVIASASTVTISGTVTGDVIAAGGTITVPGQVQGSVRAAGGNLSITGEVQEDVLVGGGTLDIGPEASIGRDLLFGGGTLALDGQVARDARVGGGEMTVRGQVGGNVRAEVEQITVADSATIGGNLTYSGMQSATIDEGATIAGQTQRLATPVATEPTMTDVIVSAVIGWLRLLVGMMLIGLALVLLFPAFSRRASDALYRAPWPSVGVGLLLVVGVPALAVAILILGIFIGGWWLAPLILGVYAMALVLGFVVAGFFVGRSILARTGNADLHPSVPLLAGLAILLLIGMVPILGWVVSVVAAISGLGALGLALWRGRQHEQAVAHA